MNTYRVEHHHDGRVRALGELRGAFAHHRSLDPFVGALLRDGTGGELRLVDTATGAVVARRRVAPLRTKPRDCFRRPGG